MTASRISSEKSFLTMSRGALPRRKPVQLGPGGIVIEDFLEFPGASSAGTSMSSSRRDIAGAVTTVLTLSVCSSMTLFLLPDPGAGASGGEILTRGFFSVWAERDSNPHSFIRN